MRIYGDTAAWFSDAEAGQFVDVSTKALELFGYERDEFLRLRPKDIIVPEEHMMLEQRREQARKRWGLGQWWTCRRKDGSTFKMQCRFHMQEYVGRFCFFVMVVKTSKDAPLTYGDSDGPEDEIQSSAAAD